MLYADLCKLAAVMLTKLTGKEKDQIRDIDHLAPLFEHVESLGCPEETWQKDELGFAWSGVKDISAMYDKLEPVNTAFLILERPECTQEERARALGRLEAKPTKKALKAEKAQKAKAKKARKAEKAKKDKITKAKKIEKAKARKARLELAKVNVKIVAAKAKQAIAKAQAKLEKARALTVAL